MFTSTSIDIRSNKLYSENIVISQVYKIKNFKYCFFFKFYILFSKLLSETIKYLKFSYVSY